MINFKTNNMSKITIGVILNIIFILFTISSFGSKFGALGFIGCIVSIFFVLNAEKWVVFFLLVFVDVILLNFRFNEFEKEQKITLTTTVNSESELSNFINGKTFNTGMEYCNWKGGSFFITYHFFNQNVNVNLQDRRTDEQFNYTSTYSVKSSKYADNGKKFYYISVHVLGDGAIDNTEYWVYDNGGLVLPRGNCVEDNYGLELREWQIKSSKEILTSKK
jgi:hypothetical protein